MNPTTGSGAGWGGQLPPFASPVTTLLQSNAQRKFSSFRAARRRILNAVVELFTA